MSSTSASAASDLGPRMACAALRFYSQRDLHFHFVSNLDPGHLAETLRRLSPENTLFIVASKTFTTQETMANAAGARAWLLEHFADQAALGDSFRGRDRQPAGGAGLSASPPENVFEFWDWVGGRYSLTSAVGLPVMMAVGPERFEELLRGCAAMDGHFRRRRPGERTCRCCWPCWESGRSISMGAATHAVLPYDQYLRRFPAYLQQLDMESNGKGVDRGGRRRSHYTTGPVVWGEPGTNGQHAFFQLAAPGQPAGALRFHRFLPLPEPFLPTSTSSCWPTCSPRARPWPSARPGPSSPRKRSRRRCGPSASFPDNRPSNTILADELTPGVLGRLVALYEHKVFVQGVIWNIFSFDQWGVELGKKHGRKDPAPAGG